ncbi:MAG: hypothetical protein AABZ53_17060 [Planctomycetota bacterium]
MQRLSLVSPCLILASLCGVASAQPKLVITGLGNDIAANGNGVAGQIYDASVEAYVPYTWTRTGGYVRIPGVYADGGSGVHSSADLGALAMSAENLTDWGSLNCFNGYCFGSMTNCTPGEPRPPINPCQIPSISHRWTAQTGWTPTGSFPRFLDGATGRYYGGTRCDYDINSPNAISGNGRYLVGGAWSALLTTPSGGPSFGMCGNFFGFRYDSVTGAFDQLQTTYGTSRADRVNFDGSVITGYDLDPAQSLRRTVVWRNGVMTILDPYLGAKDNAAINAPGTLLAMGATPELVAEKFPGQEGARLVRWSLSGNTWVPQNLGNPDAFPDPNSGVPIPFGDVYVTAISDDGNTIVGTAQYGAPPPSHSGLQRPFIWRPSINGGVPMDLEFYINSIDNQSNPIFGSGLSIASVRGLSADGNALLLAVRDETNTCSYPNISLNTGHTGILYLNASAVPCAQPRIALGPVDTIDESYTPFGVSLNVFASGSWPLSYVWQREDDNNPGTWNDLTESCQNFDRLIDWDFEGVFKNQLRIGQANCGGTRAGNYRVVVSNSCGSVTSQPASVTFDHTIKFTHQPDDLSTTGAPVTMYIGVLGGGPNTDQWEIADPNGVDGFTPIYDGDFTAPDGRVLTFEGAFEQNLRITPGAWASPSSYGFRCVVTGPCHTNTTRTATLTICAADFDGDGTVDFFDYDAFVNCFEGLFCPPGKTADFDGDGSSDFFDYDAFVVAFEAGC